MAKRASKKDQVQTPQVIDVTPEQENPDLALISSEGGGIVGFIQGLRQFMAGAADIETRSVQSLEVAKGWTKPATKQDAERIQNGIRQATQDIKHAQDYWGITSLMSRLHKRLVAHRDRPVENLEEVKRLGNVQVNWWNNEQTRIANENARLERERLEAIEKQNREREQAELERKAVEAEEASPDLSARETAFVFDYCRNGGKGQAAATYAGYKDPIAQSARLLTNEKIKAAILAKQSATAIRQQATAIKEMPIDVEVNVAKPATVKGTRTTYGAEITDAEAFIAAVFEGKHGIPRDVMMINESMVRDYGSKMHELIDRWPGVRHTKKTGTV